MEHFDVVIVGAGLSGIGAGYHLKTYCPTKSYIILEARDKIGGTWDLFRYPGIRSDSDMYTLGYAFKPWKEAKAIADGPSILKYVNETAQEHGIDQRIRFKHKVKRAAWSSETATWTLEIAASDSEVSTQISCNFLHMCSGYYDYDAGYTPDFAGRELFEGILVHPQHWPKQLNYAGKRVVVIGSGATAVTLVPEMAKTAQHVVMLQRSPTYVVSRPAVDKIADGLRARLPAMLAYRMIRWKNVLLGMVFFNMARKRPEKVKAAIIDGVRQQLGPDFDVATHFTPRYNPWDQRLCLVPDADLFTAIRAGSASVVTDQIDCFVPNGVRLQSGKLLEADIIVTATGLKLQLLSGLEVTVDGEGRSLAKSMSYKGMMYSDIPNLASSFGYTNASWTLKADLTCAYVCRLLNHMDQRGFAYATPRVRDPDIQDEPWLDFSSGYVLRGADQVPRQGNKKPWKLYQNYALDLMTLRFGAVDDGSMEFSRLSARKTAA